MADTRPPDPTEVSPELAATPADSNLQPASAPRIVGLGVACLDYLFKAPHVPPGGQAALSHYTVEGGGLVATALVAAARLGAQAQIRTWIGDDDEGRLVLSGLEREGVDTEAVTIVPDAPTAVSFIHVTEATGERTIHHRRGPTPSKDQMAAAAVLEGDYDAALIDDVWPEAGLALAQSARKAKVPVVGDFSPRESLRQLAGAVDALIVPQTCAKQLSPDGDWSDRLQALSALGPSLVVITAGADGCYYLEEGEVAHQPAFPVDVVDTTGAGDVFHGAFAYALGVRWPVRHCVRFAAAVAALSTRALGGRNAIPALDEVQRLLR